MSAVSAEKQLDHLVSREGKTVSCFALPGKTSLKS
jgi:hypothetical protein